MIPSAAHQQPVPEQEMVAEHVSGNQENNKRRKRKSKVWEEMTECEVDGKPRAKCNHCGKDFDGLSKKGTTHLRNHLERCRRKRNGGENPDKSMKTSDVIGEKCLIDLIKSWFDDEGRPTEHWDPSVLNSRKVDILQAHQAEKEKHHRFFSQLSSRFSLRIKRHCYFSVVTVHYIDEHWEPNSKIISFLHGNHDSMSSMATLKKLCFDLNIDEKICSVVHFQTFTTTDEVIGEIDSWCIERGSLPFCELGPIWNAPLYWLTTPQRFGIDGIVRCIDYVKKAPNQDNFQIALDKVKSMGKKVTSKPLPENALFLDDLEITLGYREAFCELEQIDTAFKTINLTKEQWDQVTVMWELSDSILSTFKFDETNSTPNMWFSMCCDIYVKLLQAERSAVYRRGENTSPWTEKLSCLRQKFDIFWNKCNLVLVITVILDPRFKMEIVQLWYNTIYGRDADHYLEKIIHDFKNVYNEYAEGMETSSISYLDAMGRPCASSHNLTLQKSELDMYLEEPKFPRYKEFDILAWWRLHSPIYPILTRMARDFLPVSFSFKHSEYWENRVYNIYEDEELDDDLKSAIACLLGSEV